MGRIHPTNQTKSNGNESSRSSSNWTVWKKSSMAFQGTDGFSVYDNEGKLAFRVDNYSRKQKELLLMDGSGRPLLFLQPQILSIHDQWNVYKGEEDMSKTRSKLHIFSMKRRRSILSNNSEVEIYMSNNTTILKPDFQIEGCFWKRSCKIRSKSGEVVAQISRKKAGKSVVLSDDVFNLVIEPGVESKLVIAFIVLMDRICPKPYTPFLCS